jgi:hypothetical protein
MARLRYEVGVVNGTEGSAEEADALFEAAKGKIRESGCGIDFGARVTVRFHPYKDEGPHEEHGYLTCLPGDDDPEMDAIVHIPHTMGEKQDGGPVWSSLLHVAALPDVLEVIVDDTRFSRDDLAVFHTRSSCDRRRATHTASPTGSGVPETLCDECGHPASEHLPYGCVGLVEVSEHGVSWDEMCGCSEPPESETEGKP